MSSNNNNNDAAAAIGLAVGFIGMVLAMIGLFIAAVIGFLCFIMTILSLLAWNRPLHLGQIVIQPEQAREFVLRGLFFAVTIPAFLIFCAVLFGFPLSLEAIGYIALGGYVFGSIGIEMMDEDGQAASNQPVHHHPPRHTLPAQPQRMLPPSNPFRYASWDDEEEKRR